MPRDPPGGPGASGGPGRLGTGEGADAAQEVEVRRAARVLEDPARLAAVRATGLLEAPSEAALDRLAALAARLLQAPVATVTLVDADRQVYAGCVGLPEPLATVRQTPLDVAFCRLTVADAALGALPAPAGGAEGRALPVLAIPDTRRDPRTRGMPPVTHLGVHAYAGIPLVLDGQPVGTLCVMDRRPRAWTADELDTLAELGRSATAELQLRAANRRLAAQAREGAERARGLEAQAAELALANEHLQAQAAELEAQAEELQTTAAHLEEQTEAAGAARLAAEAERERAEAVLEGMADAYFLLDADWRIAAVNGAMERRTGMRRDELLGRDFWATFPGAAGTAFETHYRRIAAGGGRAHFTHDYSDGRLDLVVEVDAYPGPVGADGRRGVAVFWRDVTSRVRAEAAVRASEERYALAARATYNAIWDWDLATDALAWSEGLFARFGYLPDAVPPGSTPEGVRFWYDHIHPDDRPRVVAGIHRVIDDPGGGTVWEDAYRFQRADGAYADVLDRGHVARDAAGRARRMIGAMEDVTARRAAEAALAGQERLLRTVAENATLGLFVMDAEQRCTYMNPAAERLTGFTLGELQGRALHYYVHHTRPDGSHYPLEECPIDRALPQNEREQGTETFVHRDGSFYPVAFTASPIRDAATGAPVGTIIEVRGIAAEHAAAAERERLLGERERLLAESERARADAEARRAEAEAASQAKGLFLANMSHELRTPLNAIGGYTQLLDMGLHGPVTDDQKGALGRIQTAQTRLLSLINDVLNYAKLESGKVEYDVRAVDVRDVVAEVTPLVEPQLRAKGLAFEVTLSEAPCVVWADREKLGQVLVNLLSNAVKFTDSPDPRTGEPGRVTVSVATRPDGPDAGRPELAFVRVADTGRGVPREKQESIFEPFVQVRTGYAQATEGTGLGLAISRDLARGMGGDLRVRSTDGAGSTFTVALRRVVDATGQLTDRRNSDERREDERRTGESRRILLAPPGAAPEPRADPAR